jgi:predicted RNA-binding Zn ribbon-like protein
MSRPIPEPVFEFSAGEICLDFCNTVGDRPEAKNDKLTGYETLLAWGRQAFLLNDEAVQRLRREAKRHAGESAVVFRRALGLRDSLYRIFAALAAGRRPPRTDLDHLNERLADALTHLQVIREGDRFEWQWGGSREALDRMLWPVLRSAADLLTSERRARIRECDSSTCSWLFLDRSRAARRRWCDMSSCGNRNKARRYYQRKKAAEASST